MFSLIYARINGWVNNGEAGELRRHRAHYDVIVMHLQDQFWDEVLLKSDYQFNSSRSSDTYKYHFAWRKHENVSRCTGSRVNTNYERIASCVRCQCWTEDHRILETPLAAHCCSQRLNHTAMTHPSKADWQNLTITGLDYWLDAKPCQLISVTFQSKYKHFHWGNLFWKPRLQSGDHFASTSMG